MNKPAFVSSDIYQQTGYKPNHPLSIQRVGTSVTLCEQLGWLDRSGIQYYESPRADIDALTQFHDAAYVNALIEAENSAKTSQEVRERYHLGTMENPVFVGLFERASTSVGGSVRAAQLALEHGVAYHPAGGTHHGLPNRASGFCYFNDPVFAIMELIKQGVERVAYVDVDAHHGDGVEYAFADNPNVLTLSLHEEGRWPNTGPTGMDCARSIGNVILPRNINDNEYALLCEQLLMPALREFAPGAIVVTCGADGLDGDPLSSMELSNGCLWKSVLDMVELGVPSVIVGGGGYNPWTVTRCWAGLWGKLNGYEMPPELPGESRAMLAGFESDLVDEEDVQAHWLLGIEDPANEEDIRKAVHETIAAFQS